MAISCTTQSDLKQTLENCSAFQNLEKGSKTILKNLFEGALKNVILFNCSKI